MNHQRTLKIQNIGLGRQLSSLESFWVGIRSWVLIFSGLAKSVRDWLWTGHWGREAWQNPKACWPAELVKQCGPGSVRDRVLKRKVRTETEDTGSRPLASICAHTVSTHMQKDRDIQRSREARAERPKICFLRWKGRFNENVLGQFLRSKAEVKLAVTYQ